MYQTKKSEKRMQLPISGQ